MTKRSRVLWQRFLQGRLARPVYRTLFRFNGGEYRPIPTDNAYVADPFVFVQGVRTFLFYETLKDKKGVLGCFRWENGSWRDLGIVLEEPWHLSYPQVFEEDGRVYMIPESCDFRGRGARGAVRLYEAEEFPSKWKLASVLIREPFSDSTLLRKDGNCYLFCDREFPDEAAELWWSPSVFGPWTRHPQSGNCNQSRRLRRCGGSVLVPPSGSRSPACRIAQDCNGAYGRRLFKVPILKLSPEEYQEGRAEPFHGNFRHTYNRQETPDGMLEVLDELSYDFTPTPRSVLKALAIPFQCLVRRRRDRPALFHIGGSR